MNNRLKEKNKKKEKGFVLVVDVMIALILIILLININDFENKSNYKSYEIITISQQINDILITSQQLELTENNEKEIIENIQKLIPNRKVSLIINNKTIEINEKLKYSENLSNSIRYINSSNKEIYMEIIVFY